jgi:hypothetical protein
LASQAGDRPIFNARMAPGAAQLEQQPASPWIALPCPAMRAAEEDIGQL